jgi:hypothetical protein
MAEDLIILLILLAVLLILSFHSTRETMKDKIQEMDPKVSHTIIVNALAKKGPEGTFSAFDTQLKTYEDLASYENDNNDG